ncbi:scarecrow-like protein 30 [Silene latifolia]|uniref:scarecrow-like protein 30 n=1 Tax=Silene latifolia TaxID=37657 RepID=UPI003D76CBE3
MYTNFANDQQNNDPFTYCNQFTNFSSFQQQQQQQSFDECCHIVPYQLINPAENNYDAINLTEVPEIPDTCFNYITNLLRENDSEDRPGVTLHDYMTAQVSYNKSLDAALVLGELPAISSYNVNFNATDSIIYQNNAVNDVNDPGLTFVDENYNTGSCVVPTNVINVEPSFGFCPNDSWNFESGLLQNGLQGDMNVYSNTLLQNSVPEFGFLQPDCPNFIGHQDIGEGDKTGKTRARENNENNEGDHDDGRVSKQSAASSDWCEKIEQYGDVLLCPEGRSKPAALCGKSKSTECVARVVKKRGGKGKGQVADLRSLLTRCAQCVARVDLTGAYDLLKQIRQNSSPYGDFLQRVAHYLANGLEARLEGKGSEITRANENIPPCEVLKANRAFVGSVPYKIMSYYTTNKTIASLAMESSSIHIIDFGIYYGLQWPCIIQNLSKRPNGPPKIRVTGIDFPLSGFRPADRIEETGRCLAKYCEKYNVPFEYNGIAQPWEMIKLEDLKINQNEPLVVNCLYRSHNLFDESIDDSSPRDAFLRLVRKINPDMFMHGVVNSTSSVPFFLNRFKEVMFHYSALFDVFESTMSREDNERMLLESKLYGNQALNVIACEGVERVERHETYKQWTVRTQRAGFEQVPLDRDLLRRARAMVKRSFRDEFSYDEDGHWVVQGWKGRILYAISCWKPT